MEDGTRHLKQQGGQRVRREEISTIKGFVFDCDGVLINSKAANVRFYNLILEELGLPRMSPAGEAFVHAHTVQKSIAHIVPESLLDKALEAKKSIPYSRVLESIRLEPGISVCLRCLQGAGFPCAVNTNRTDTMELILDKFDLNGYFHPVVTSQDVRRPKPHPESLELILDIWKLSPDEVVFIGDSEVDEQTARAAGTLFWAYNNAGLAADRHLREHGELAAALPP